MAQVAKIIDLTKSYLPIDPQAFAQNLSYTAQEDQPEKGLPIVAYEGYNMLPTSYGYRSYFGIETTLTLDALPKKCDEILSFQSSLYENAMIALCSDGIYIAKAGSTAWTHAVTLTDTFELSGVYSQYTWCIIENNLYIYRQGHSHVIKVNDLLAVSTFVPSFLNMAGQMGIFRANGRIGFWDSEDSVSWSSAFDLTDFTPSIENLVGNTKFFGVLGRIVTILPHGEGFVIYSTKSVVGVGYANSNTVLWDAAVIMSGAGIAHPKAACIGQTSKEHFAYTNTGIIKVGHYNALSRQYEREVVLPELYDFLKESRDPVYMTCHANRYLHFSLVDPNYINGITSFTHIEVPTLEAPLITIDTSLFNTYANKQYLWPKETFQYLLSFLWNPTANLRTDRTQPVFDAPRYTAVMRVPNIPASAITAGLLNSGDTSKYKGRVLDLDYPSLVDLFDDLDNREANRVYDYLFDSTAWLKSLLTSIATPSDTAKPDVTYNGTVTVNTCIERSIFTNLYPQDIGINNVDGASCVDIIYNFYSLIREYDAWLTQHKEELFQRLEDLVILHTRKIYSRYGNPIPNNSNVSGDTTNKVRIPKLSTYQTVIHQASDLSYNTFADTLSLWVLYNDYYEISATGSNRTVGNSAPIPLQNARNIFGVRSFVDPFGLTSPYAYFDHMPTMDDITAALNAEGNRVVYLGAEYIIAWNPAATSSPFNLGIGFGTYGNQLIMQNVSTGAYVQGGVYITHEVHPEVTHLHYYVETDFNECSILYNAGYQYLCDMVYQSSSINPNGINAREVLLATLQQKFFYSATPQLQTRVLGALITLEKVPFTLEAGLADGEWVIKAKIQGVAQPQAIFYLKSNKVQESELIEDIKLQVTEKTYVGSASALEFEQTAFSLTFTKQAVDEVTHILDSYQVTDTTSVFTPSWTDPGADQPLVFSSTPSPAYWKPTFPANSTIRDMACHPMDIYRNNSAGYIKGMDFMKHVEGVILDVEMPLGPLPLVDDLLPCYVIDEFNGWVTANEPNFVIPGSSYELQVGTPVPAYPMFAGSLVFDLHLKKWGKQKNIFNALLEFQPLNATDDAIVPYSNFGMNSGVLRVDNKIALFTQNPIQSFMRYGKIGLYRLGFTEALEIILHFRVPSTGKVVVDGSLEGRDLSPEIQHEETFTDVRKHTVKCHVNAMWHTISISGNFDLQFMEFRGILGGRR